MKISELDETEEWIDVPLDEPKDYGSDIEEVVENMITDDEKAPKTPTPSDNDESDSDDEQNVFNSATVVVPEEPANNIFINTTKKKIKKRIRKNGPVIEIAPGEQKDVQGNWYSTDNTFDICAFQWLYFLALKH